MKIKQLKIINQDESTEVADIGADAVNIDYNDTNVKLKLDELSNNIDTNTTNISNEITTRANSVTSLQSQIRGLASGSPKGAYTTTAALVSANPDTGVYVVTADGHIYSWTKNANSAIDLGIYQAAVSAEITDNSITTFKINSSLKKRVIENYTDIIDLFSTPTESGKYCTVNDNNIVSTISNASFNYIKIKLDLYSNYYFTGWCSSIIDTILIVDENNNLKQKIERPTSSTYKDLYITVNNEDRYIYFSYQNGTSSYYRIRNALTYLRKLNNIVVVNNQIEKITTIEDFILQDNLVVVDSQLQLNPIQDPTTYKIKNDIYKIKAGFTYRIKSQNQTGIAMLGIVITDNENIVKYKSNIDTTDLLIYNFTPNYDGMIYAQYRENVTEVPMVEIVDGFIELKDYIDSFALENYSNWKWGLLGDSITESNWRASKHYWNYIQEITNIQLDNCAISGAGYKIYSPYNTYNQVDNLASDDDFVTIFAGVNDIAWTSSPSIGDITDTISDNTILGYVNGTIDKILIKYNYSKPIGIISPLPSCIQDVFSQPDYQGNLYPSAGNNNMELFVSKLEELCKFRGIPFLDMYHFSGLQPQNSNCRELLFKAGSTYAADGLHPNAEGHKFIYGRILNFIKQLL